MAEEVAPARAIWRLGDYHRFALEQMWAIGPIVVQACGISSGRRVLDVAAGSGNVAIPAAEVLVVVMPACRSERHGIDVGATRELADRIKSRTDSREGQTQVESST